MMEPVIVHCHKPSLENNCFEFGGVPGGFGVGRGWHRGRGLGALQFHALPRALWDEYGPLDSSDIMGYHGYIMGISWYLDG